MVCVWGRGGRSRVCVSVRVFTFRFLYYFIHYKCCVSSVHFFFFHLSHVNKRTRTISPSMLISFHIFLIYLYSPLLSSFLSLFLNVEHNVFFFLFFFGGKKGCHRVFLFFFIFNKHPQHPRRKQSAAQTRAFHTCCSWRCSLRPACVVAVVLIFKNKHWLASPKQQPTGDFQTVDGSGDVSRCLPL